MRSTPASSKSRRIRWTGCGVGNEPDRLGSGSAGPPARTPGQQEGLLDREVRVFGRDLDLGQVRRVEPLGLVATLGRGRADDSLAHRCTDLSPRTGRGSWGEGCGRAARTIVSPTTGLQTPTAGGHMTARGGPPPKDTRACPRAVLIRVHRLVPCDAAPMCSDRAAQRSGSVLDVRGLRRRAHLPREALVPGMRAGATRGRSSPCRPTSLRRSRMRPTREDRARASAP